MTVQCFSSSLALDFPNARLEKLHRSDVYLTETSLSHGTMGVQLGALPEPFRQPYGIEGFKEGPQPGPHRDGRRKPLRQWMYISPVWSQRTRKKESSFKKIYILG